MRQTQIFSGSSHPALVDGICERLGTRPASANLNKFANGETRVEIETSIREQDVFLVQSGSDQINDAVMELLIMASACKGGSAKSVTAVMPYFPYSRQSKKKSHRGAITARMLANLLNVAGVDHVITLDLHASQMQGFFKCPVDNLVAEPLIARWVRHHIPDWQNAVVVSKNAGGTKRVTSLADVLKLSFGIVTTDRRRFRPYGGGDYSVNGSVILERFANGDGTAEEALEAAIADNRDANMTPVQSLAYRPPPPQPHTQTHTQPKSPPQEEEKHMERPQIHHSRTDLPNRRRATSNALARRMYNQSIEIPNSPLSKSVVMDRPTSSSSASSGEPAKLVRVNTAPEAPLSHEAHNTEEFIDERARDVTFGRLIHGHIVDDDVPSPAMSASSVNTWRSRNYGGPNHHRTSSSDEDEEPPPHMLTSFMSTASSVRHREEPGALGGTVDAAASDEEEEEDLKNPELETTITLVGNVRNRPVFIVDDMIDKAGSWVAAAECCVKRGGATKVYCLATHGLFGETALQEMEECECIEKIIVTNSFPLSAEKQATSSKLVMLDISGLLAEAIRRNHHGENISQLYMHWND